MSPASVAPTHDSPIEDCRRKRRYTTKRSAKLAAKGLPGEVNVYECPHPNPDGSPGTHWHCTRRRTVPAYVKAARAAAAFAPSGTDPAPV